jgi:SSS family solute:Na+ symporter
MSTCHFYIVGAIPAMLFLGIFMMPFYYGSKARSVPEYLKMRYDEKTRAFNALSFATMTVFASGISMYAMAMLMETLLGWNFTFGLVMSAVIVLTYTYLGGLTSAIYNEVLQFFLMIIGFLPLVILGMRDIGGWENLKAQLGQVAVQNGMAPNAYTSTWSNMGSPAGNPMGVEWFGLFMGLGFVLSFGYWCTDFLVVQRAMAAKSMNAARRTPIIGSFPKMFIPVIVIIPGMIAMALTSSATSGFALPLKDGVYDYDKVIPMLLGHYVPTGALGLGITALMASFMSGMAGNVTAFNTVWTYDIYQSYLRPGQSDKHYLRMGHMATVFGILASMLTALVAKMFNNVMDLLQLIFAFINAPLFATFLLGMFSKRTTGHGAFYGLLGGTAAAALHHGLTKPAGAASLIKGGWLGQTLHQYPSEMAQNFWTAIFAFAACLTLTFVISMFTERTKTDEELTGLVYSLTPRIIEEEEKWYNRPVSLAVLAGSIAVLITIAIW